MVRKKAIAYLGRDAILGAQDIRTEDVLVPEWGGTVKVRGMTGTQRNAFEKSITREKPAGNRTARRTGQTTTEIIAEEVKTRLVAWCVVDEHGTRVFHDDDLQALNEKSASALEKIVDAAMRLSGMDEEDVSQMAEEMIAIPFEEGSSL